MGSPQKHGFLDPTEPVVNGDQPNECGELHRLEHGQQWHPLVWLHEVQPQEKIARKDLRPHPVSPSSKAKGGPLFGRLYQEYTSE